MAERKSKTDVVNAIAASTGLAKNVVAEVLDAKLDVIKDLVAAGNEVVFVGFGTYGASQRSARTGRNPQTGQEIKIPAAKLPRFRAGKAFKDAVNGVTA
ncbi:MAG: HU family DNA-binding protein [Gammaproteobacteria bacterium]